MGVVWARMTTKLGPYVRKKLLHILQRRLFSPQVTFNFLGWKVPTKIKLIRELTVLLTSNPLHKLHKLPRASAEKFPGGQWKDKDIVRE